MKNLYILIFFLVTALFGKGDIEFNNFKTTIFSPTKDENVSIGFKLYKPSRVEIDILSEDGHLVKTIKSNGILSKGSHVLVWNGKDKNGTVVPDEAYIPILKALDINATYDTREFSGGEVEEKIDYSVYPDGKIEYKLKNPSRVLIRVGIKNGAMLKSLLNWKQKLAGKNIQYWNGYDNDNLTKIINKNYSVLVTAFNLPKYSIITRGNKKLTYSKYYQNRSWKESIIPRKEQKFERNGKRVSPHYYLPRILDKDPKVEISLEGNFKRDKSGIPIIKNGQPIRVKVDVPKDNLKYIEKVKYEVSFFIDYSFVSEEEQGYIPISWDWIPNGLKKGEHIMSVNISAFKGQVGVKSLKFLVESI